MATGVSRHIHACVWKTGQYLLSSIGVCRLARPASSPLNPEPTCYSTAQTCSFWVSARYPNWGLHTSAASHLSGPPKIILIHFFLVNKDNKSSHMPQRLLKWHYTFETKELTKKHLVANIFLLVNWPRSVIFEYLNVRVIKTVIWKWGFRTWSYEIQTGLWSTSLIK